MCSKCCTCHAKVPGVHSTQLSPDFCGPLRNCSKCCTCHAICPNAAPKKWYMLVLGTVYMILYFASISILCWIFLVLLACCILPKFSYHFFSSFSYILVCFILVSGDLTFFFTFFFLHLLLHVLTSFFCLIFTLFSWFSFLGFLLHSLVYGV